MPSIIAVSSLVNFKFAHLTRFDYSGSEPRLQGYFSCLLFLTATTA